MSISFDDVLDPLIEGINILKCQDGYLIKSLPRSTSDTKDVRTRRVHISKNAPQLQ